MKCYNKIQEAVLCLEDGPYKYECGRKSLNHSELPVFIKNYPQRPEWARYYVDPWSGTIIEEIGTQKKTVLKRIGGWQF